MAGRASDPAKWLIRGCPSCGVKCRVRLTAGGTAVRCPSCGGTIPPARPRSDEDNDRPYVVNAADQIAPRSEPLPEADELEIRRHTRQRPKKRPVWSGVLTFPWRPDTLRAWFFFGVGFTLVAAMAACLYYIIWLHQSTDNEAAQGVWSRVYILFMKGFVLFLFWTGAYASGFFCATVEDTGAGMDRIAWPDYSIKEQVVSFLYLVWVLTCAAVPVGFLVAPLHWILHTTWVYALGVLPAAVFLFPLAFFSSLTNNYSLWNYWNSDMLVRLFSRPLVVLVMYAYGAAILAVCVVLGYLAITDEYFLLPLTGFTWSAAVLMYGKLLGNVAWAIADDGRR